ncbi:esterase FE4-like [Nymphalis io]|uniref:esterase FE4-like n=1 Tax=Inachis io TaxID=171585 RepID=UPI0021675625|nr:esterase FE4-like [Nymphalis io]
MLVKQGIIVVIIRHRLGPVGFLCLSEDKIPGNAGLKDVVLALRWVRDNINAFRGNPNKVIVAGQSFGAALVESLMLTPMAKGLFHGVILQSGTVLAPWAFNYDAENRAKFLKMQFNGSRDSLLSRVEIADLAGRSEDLELPYLPFGICVEKPLKNEERLLSQSPFDIISSGNMAKVPMIIGYTNNEAYVFASMLKSAKALRKMSKGMDFLLPSELQTNKRDIPQLVNKVNDMYFDGNMTMASLLAYHRDAYFLGHIHRSVRLHASFSDSVYYYQFSYSGNVGVEGEPGMIKTGAAHSDELAYLFPARGQRLDDDDGIVQENIVRLWTNFVKHLNPTPENEHFLWEPVNTHDARLLDINVDLRMIEFPYKRETQMWKDIYEKYYYENRRYIDLIDESVGVAKDVSNVTSVAELENVNPMRAERIEEITEILVETENGAVRGYKDNNEIIGFFDIPYGTFSEEKPFEEPSTPNNWNTVLENTEHKSKCPQIDSENKYIGSSTCLTLSIFLQRNTENADVLFHIHDSSLNKGSGNPSEYVPKHVVSKGIILVLPNYRIGPLGFLCLQNETAPGNAGLKDLNLALQWTKTNIKAFGGNASNIAISGSGGAGALLEYLILSNQSRALISKAITESGFALSPWALDRYPLETAKSLMKKIAENENNVELETGYSIFDTANLETLVRAGQGLLFKPCIENNTGFLTKSPWYVLNNEIIRISIMMGSANQAAMEMALAHTEQSLSQLNQDYSKLLPNDLKFDNSEERIRIGRQVRTEYFGENNITINDMEKLSQCFTDSQYLYPGIRGARLLAKGGAQVYFYEFAYGTHNDVKGAARGDSLNYVFSKDEEENTLQKVMLDLWASFIKSGRPTTEKIDWNNLEAVEQTEETWLSIADTVVVEKGYHYTRLKQWDEIYKKYFVERNFALKLNSSIYITVLGSILLTDISNYLKF